MIDDDIINLSIYQLNFFYFFFSFLNSLSIDSSLFGCYSSIVLNSVYYSHPLRVLFFFVFYTTDYIVAMQITHTTRQTTNKRVFSISLSLSRLNIGVNGSIETFWQLAQGLCVCTGGAAIK